MGKALFDHQNVPIHLIMVMYKHMLGMPITINDLETIDYSLKQGQKISLKIGNKLKLHGDDDEVKQPQRPSPIGKCL